MALRQALAEAGGLAAIDRFLNANRNIPRADRELPLDWADDAVRGLFEVRRADAAPTVLNLVDDLEYRVYGLAQSPPRNSFIIGMLLPLADDDSAWLASGTESFHPETEGRPLAPLAIGVGSRGTELVFRNPEKVKQGWEHMRRDREEFLAFFGTDELVLPTAAAEGRLNDYYRQRRGAGRAARGR